MRQIRLMCFGRFVAMPTYCPLPDGDDESNDEGETKEESVVRDKIEEAETDVSDAAGEGTGNEEESGPAALVEQLGKDRGEDDADDEGRTEHNPRQSYTHALQMRFTCFQPEFVETFV